MDPLAKAVLERWQQPASMRRDTAFRRWSTLRRYVPLVLILLVLAVAARSVSAFRSAGSPVLAQPATTENASQATNLSSEVARKVDLTWVQADRADLCGRALEGARLTGADLRGADLRKANLSGATLLGAHFSTANLSGAVLRRADLHYAVLIDADLKGADLRWANLQWANLQYADLRGARLTYAQVHRAYLHGAILPDGTLWRPDRDLARFTDPAHPAYWKSTAE